MLLSTAILLAGQWPSTRLVVSGTYLTTHMHIPLHIRKLLQRTSGLVVVTLDQVSKRIQCVLLGILQNIKCKQCACGYPIINCLLLRQRAWLL